MGCFVKYGNVHADSVNRVFFACLFLMQILGNGTDVQKEENMNILMWIVIIVGGGVGIITTLYMVLSIPTVIVWKIYRKIRFKKSLYA